MKRANAIANASPKNDESAELSEAGGAIRPLTCFDFDETLHVPTVLSFSSTPHNVAVYWSTSG